MLYLLLSALAPLFAIACAACMLAGDFVLAWWAGLAIALSMEARVQVGGRLPSSILKAVHIMLAAGFFIALSALALGIRPVLLREASLFLLLATFAAALPLWYAGARRALGQTAEEITAE